MGTSFNQSYTVFRYLEIQVSTKIRGLPFGTSFLNSGNFAVAYRSSNVLST